MPDIQRKTLDVCHENFNDNELEILHKNDNERIRVIASVADSLSDILTKDYFVSFLKRASKTDDLSFNMLSSSDNYSEHASRFFELKSEILMDESICKGHVMDDEVCVPVSSLQVSRLVRYDDSDGPTDRFYINDDVRDYLMKAYEDFNPCFVQVDDILEELPFVDCEIVLKRTVMKSSGEEQEVEYSSRVFLYDNIKEMYDDVDSDKEDIAKKDMIPVGFLDMRIPGIEDAGILVPLLVRRGFKYLLHFPAAVPYGLQQHDDVNYDIHNMMSRDFTTLVAKHMQTWLLVIHMCKLHKSLLKDARRMKDRRKRISGLKMPTATRKINCHYWTVENLERVTGTSN